MNHGTVRLHQERLHEQGVLERTADLLGQLAQALGDLVRRDGRGETAVHRLHETVVLEGDGAADDSEGAEVLVGALDAHAAAIRVVEQLLVQLEERALVGAAQAVLQQVVHDEADGVDTVIGQRGVRTLAGGLEPRAAGAGLGHDDAVGALQLVGVGIHDGVGQARHRVRGRAALELHDDARTRLDGLAHEHAVVAALLAVAHGELRVGREQEGRVIVVQVVVGHVGHAGFLVRAEQEAHGVGELRGLALVLQVLPELHGVQRHDAGALVVQRAAADEVAVLARDLVGLEGPAGTGRHHVHVADDAQLRVRGAGEVGEADVALGIVGCKAHAARQLERRSERLLGAGAERGTVGLLVVFLEAGDAHERGDVVHHGVPVLLKVGVYLLG